MNIAEIGCNHGGDLELAKRMISVAARFCEVDAVKFQKRDPATLLTPEQFQAPHQGQRIEMQRRRHRPVIGGRGHGGLVSGYGRCHRVPPGCGSKPALRSILPHVPGYETPSYIIGAGKIGLAPT